MKYKKIIRLTAILVLSYLNVWALNYLNGFFAFNEMWTGTLSVAYNYISVVVFVIGAFLLDKFIKSTEKRLKVVSAIAGVLLGAASVCGAYLLYVNDLFIGLPESAGQLLLIIGMSSVITAGVYCFFSWFDKLSAPVEPGSTEHKLCDIAYFLIVAAIIFAAYIPVFLVNWPGNTNCDYYAQLRDVIDDTWSTHHPMLHTWLMGAPYKLGVRIGNVGKGFQLYTLLQMAVQAGAFAYLALYMRRRKARTVLRVITIIFAALFPINQIMSITSTKDVYFSAFFLVFMILLEMYISQRGRLTVSQFAGLFVSGVLACLFRNNMVYALLVAGVIIALLLPREKKEKGIRCFLAKIKILAALAAIFATYIGANALMMKVFNAEDVDSCREKSSLFFQCMARVDQYRPGEMNPADRECLCFYIPEENLSLYNPYNADPLKNDAYESRLKADMKTFLKVWAKVGVKFPGEYIEAALTNTLGYWYPFSSAKYTVVLDVSTYPIPLGREPEINRKDYLEGTFISDMFYRYYGQKATQEIPVLGFFMRPVAYVWLVILMILWAIYKKDRNLFMLSIVPLMYMGTLLFGPLVALRYIYNLCMCAPLFLLAIKESSGAVQKQAAIDGQ